MDRNTKFGYWLVIAKHAGYKIEATPFRPKWCAGIEVPTDLNGLTMGQLLTLGGLKGDNDSVYTITETVLGIDQEQTNNARATDVVLLVGWVTTQVQRINKLFESTTTKPTSEEVRAGVKELKFGLFGLVDWYAKRMGISDHDQVMQVPWLRVYKCLDMDNKTNQYKRKLEEVIADDAKRKNRRLH